MRNFIFMSPKSPNKNLSNNPNKSLSSDFISTIAQTACMAAFLFVASGCEKKISSHGNILTDNKMSLIVPRQDNKASVQKKLGSPVITDIFNDEIWYYGGFKTEQKSFLKPKIIEEQAMAIYFDSQGFVTKVNIIDERPNIVPHSDATKVKGHKQSLWHQTLGGIRKKYSKSKKPKT